MFGIMGSSNVDSVEKLVRSIEGYVRSCRVDDGGYFFARIPPGSLLDTYYAVKTLADIGTSIECPESLKEFVIQHVENSTNGDIHGWYLASEILKHLNSPSLLRKMATGFTLHQTESLMALKPDSLYIEVSSELHHIFEYVSLLRNLRVKTSESKLTDYIRSLRNDDGGYGFNRSSLATTYYAIKTLSLLNTLPQDTEQTMEYLDSRMNSVYFLEYLFYLLHARAVLKKGEEDPSDRISFVLDCQRKGGGFARAGLMGIPTLEYTYYAVSSLDQLGFFNTNRGRTGEIV